MPKKDCWFHEVVTETSGAISGSTNCQTLNISGAFDKGISFAYFELRNQIYFVFQLAFIRVYISSRKKEKWRAEQYNRNISFKK